MQTMNFGVEELNTREARQIGGGSVEAVAVALCALIITAFTAGFKSGAEAAR